MKTILYMAISLDGKITKNDNDTDWVSDSDIERMDKLMTKAGVMIMGRNTYESFGDDLPNDLAKQVVFTGREDLLNKKQENVVFTNDDPAQVLSQIEKEGYKTAMIAGGGLLNASLLKAGLIDEIRLIVKPLIIGKGKDLFEGVEMDDSFELESVEKLGGGVVELVYKKYK